MRAVAITAVLGLDQAARTGWGIARVGGQLVTHGLARTAKERRAVVELALAHAGGDPRQLLVCFEDHTEMPAWRLSRYDHTTQRKGRAGAPERSTASLIGLGKPYGRWEERLDDIEHPERCRLKATPRQWRLRVLGNEWATKEHALQWASAFTRERIDDDNEAEGIGLTALAALEGVAMLEGKRLKQRLYARGKREERRQLELGNA